MLSVHFEGWFQCRMATDPDPSDEPRGVSGTAFALVGEPDLDSIIRLHDPVAPRTPGPTVGVRVAMVRVDEQQRPGHPLVGARVDLLGGPRFIEQNGVVVAANTAFVDPFHLCISQGEDLVLSRQALWDPRQPDLDYYAVPPLLLKPRQVRALELNVPEVLAASGVGDPPTFRDKRKQDLQAALEQVQHDPVRRAGLEQRLQALNLTDWRGKRLLLLLGGRATYAFDLNSLPVSVVDAHGVLAETLPADAPWPVNLWMGAWDNDALCGYMKGSLLLDTTSG